MKLLNLHLKNIGPFLNDTIEFATTENSKKQVTILTGENGTGKTIVLDAIRGLFLGEHNFDNSLKRKLNSQDKFNLELSGFINNKTFKIDSQNYANSFPLSLLRYNTGFAY